MAERATIARPYARAAFAHAREAGRVAEWSGWLATARDVVASEEFQKLERSPGITSADLAGLVAGICGDALDAHAKAFLALLAENGRLDFLPEIAAQFEALRAEAENVADVEVVSAAAARRTPARSGSRRRCASACVATCGCIARSTRR